MTTKNASKSDKSPRYHHGDLRNALALAAMELLEESGLEKLSLRAVARKAGVSAAAPYHHFKDKDALLCAVATEGFKEFVSVMRRHAKGYDMPTDIRAGLGTGYVVFAQERPALFRLMFADCRYLFADDPDLVAASSISYHLLANGATDMIAESGKPGGAALNARIAATSWAQAHGLAMLVGDGALQWQKLGFDSVAEMAFALLKDVTFNSLQPDA